MKKLLTILLLAAGLSLQAQTNSPPSGLIDLGNTIFGYFTSFNTNLDVTFGENPWDLWIGATAQQGHTVPLVNEIGLSYSVHRFGLSPNRSTSLEIENALRNGGVVGTVESDQLGLAFSVVIHDLKLSIYGDAGYDMSMSDPIFSTTDRIYGEIGLRVKKAIGTHFYTGAGIGAQFPRNAQVFAAFGGVTF